MPLIGKQSHLENCTGKTFREKLRSRKIPVRSEGSGTHKSGGCHFISIVLGMEWQSRQDQANKSAGWMPGH